MNKSNLYYIISLYIFFNEDYRELTFEKAIGQFIEDIVIDLDYDSMKKAIAETIELGGLHIILGGENQDET